MKRKELTAISLFAGIGGICQGFMKYGVKIVFANDFDKSACITYKANFKHGIVEKPIEDVTIEEVPDADLVIFGFPCTSFSIAGYRKGFEDEKSGNLFFEAFRIIKSKKPKAIFIENVKNLVSHDKGNTFKIIKDCLESEGYKLKYKVLNSMDYGNVPQNRERIYIVGFLDHDMTDAFEFPEPIERTVAIHDITNPSEKKPDKYYYENSKYYPMLKEAMTNKDTVYQLRRIYVRENKSNVSPTLTANMGTGGHNVPLIIDDYGIRKLTPRECLLLQGFPKNFIIPENVSNGQLYKQAGNSVTVSVIERIAKNMIDVINNNVIYKEVASDTE